MHYHHNAGCMQLNQEIFFSNRLSPSLCLKVNVHLILRFLSKVDCTNCGGQPDSVNALHPALTQPVLIPCSTSVNQAGPQDLTMLLPPHSFGPCIFCTPDWTSGQEKRIPDMIVFLTSPSVLMSFPITSFCIWL